MTWIGYAAELGLDMELFRDTCAKRKGAGGSPRTSTRPT